MHVMIVYATIEGQTRKIARSLSETVQSRGHTASLYDAADLEGADLKTANALIVAAPVHAGRFPVPLKAWLKSNAEAASAMPSAFVSVSLGAASSFPEELAEISQNTEKFLAATGWTPKAVHHAAGALRFTEYDFFKRLLMREISRHEGGPLDTSRDHEFTDWAKLAAFAGEFLGKAEAS